MKTLLMTMAFLLISSVSSAHIMLRFQDGLGSFEKNDDEITNSIALRALYYKNPDLKFGFEIQQLSPETINSGSIVLEKIFCSQIHTGISLNKYETNNNLGYSLELGWQPDWVGQGAPVIFYKAQEIPNNNVIHSINVGIGFNFL